MSETKLSEMSEQRFQAMLDQYIDRTASQPPDVDADLFVDLLFERVSARNATPITLDIVIQDNQVIITPETEDTTILVQGNEVVIDGRKLIFRVLRRAA